MNRTLLILRRAENDVERIYGWLVKRSPIGALRWRGAYLQAITEIKHDPLRFASASEPSLASRQVRQRMFRTPRGRNYRILFIVTDEFIRILRIRGPGQPPVRRHQISE